MARHYFDICDGDHIYYFKATKTMNDVFEAIRRERAYQDAKYGANRNLAITEWLQIATRELLEAISESEYEAARREILQVAAVAVACLEAHGVVEREDFSIVEGLAEERAYQLLCDRWFSSREDVDKRVARTGESLIKVAEYVANGARVSLSGKITRCGKVL